MQLMELLPHATRLIPVADKYFSSKTANEKANEAALVAMAEGVQADLGQVTAAHAGLYRKMQEQEAQIAEMRDEVRQARVAMEQQMHRVGAMEQKLASASLWIRIGMSASVVMLIIILGLLLRK